MDTFVTSRMECFIPSNYKFVKLVGEVNIDDNLEHPYLSQRHFADGGVILGFEELLDGDELAGVAPAALQHHAVGTLAHLEPYTPINLRSSLYE